jgi:hypothetical protein
MSLGSKGLSTDVMLTAGVQTGKCFLILSGLFELMSCSLMVLFVRHGVLLRELTWSQFLLNNGGGNT